MATKIYFLLRSHSIFIIPPSNIMRRKYLDSGHDRFLLVLIHAIRVTSSLYTGNLPLYIPMVTTCTKLTSINKSYVLPSHYSRLPYTSHNKQLLSICSREQKRSVFAVRSQAILRHLFEFHAWKSQTVCSFLFLSKSNLIRFQSVTRSCRLS